MANLDELIIRLREQGSANAIRGVERAEQAVVSFGRHLQQFATIGGIAAGIAGAGFALLGKDALDAAADVEQITARFSALNNSTEIGAQKMAFIKDLAKTTVGEFKDLTEAGSLLEAGGLPVERWLPVLNNIVAAFGATREHVLELSSALVRLPSGQVGESMEIFRRFGITAGDLMAQGIRFNAAGQLQSSVLDMMAAVERIAKTKFGAVGEAMGATFAVKLSNLKDVVFQTFAQIGDAMMPIAKSVVDSLASVFGFITQKGGWLADLLGGNGGDSKFSGLEHAIFVGAAYLMAVFDSAPTIFRKIVDWLGSVFDHGANGLRDVLASMNTGSLFGGVPRMLDAAAHNFALGLINAIAGFGSGLDTLFGFSAPRFGFTPEKLKEITGPVDRFFAGRDKDRERDQAADRAKWLRDNPASFWNPSGLQALNLPDVGARADVYLKQIEQYSQRTPGMPAGAGEGPLVKPGTNLGAAGMLGAMHQTARNTARAADALEGLRAEVLGGGPRTRARASSLEVEMSLARALSLGIG